MAGPGSIPAPYRGSPSPLAESGMMGAPHKFCDLDLAPLLAVELVADLHTRTVTVKQVLGDWGVARRLQEAAGALGGGEARESRKPGGIRPRGNGVWPAASSFRIPTGPRIS